MCVYHHSLWRHKQWAHTQKQTNINWFAVAVVFESVQHVRNLYAKYHFSRLYNTPVRVCGYFCLHAWMYVFCICENVPAWSAENYRFHTKHALGAPQFVMRCQFRWSRYVPSTYVQFTIYAANWSTVISIPYMPCNAFRWCWGWQRSEPKTWPSTTRTLQAHKHSETRRDNEHDFSDPRDDCVPLCFVQPLFVVVRSRKNHYKTPRMR